MKHRHLATAAGIPAALALVCAAHAQKASPQATLPYGNHDGKLARSEYSACRAQH